MTRLSFLGGTSTVTGSKFLVEAGTGSVLVDCGIFQGPRAVRARNWHDPFNGRLPDEVLITHAHIDHTGYLPRLAGPGGFAGPVMATPATVDLMRVMLPDSARLQEEEAAYRNRKGYTRHKPALPLYTEADAAAALALARPVGYHRRREGIAGRYRFAGAGHILGSSHITVEAGGARLVFSGDLGRWDIPVLKDPEPPPAADLVVMESTYGDRLHDQDHDPDELLAGVVDRIVASGGILLIPAFAIGRTQDILYRLRRLEESGRVPVLPVFLDSPMAIDATRLYAAHREEHDLEMTRLSDGAGSALRPDRLVFTQTVEESKALNGLDGPAVIVSASGMATGGRIVHHLKRRLPDPASLVLFVGYQAAGTRGRYLVEGADEITIHGRRVPVRAGVTRIDGFSAHADRSELLRWLGEAEEPPARVALVHGEPDARRALAAAIVEELGLEVVVPEEGDAVEV